MTSATRRPGETFTPAAFAIAASTTPHTTDITRLCDHGYESNTIGVNAVAPGVIVACSTPVIMKIGQMRSSAETPAMSQPRLALGAARLAPSATARCPTNIYGSSVECVELSVQLPGVTTI